MSMNFFLVERVLVLLEDIQKLVYVTKKDSFLSLVFVRDKLREFLSSLETIFTSVDPKVYYDPRITHLILREPEIMRILAEVEVQVYSFDEEEAKIISRRLKAIRYFFKKWYDDIFKPKIAPFLEGNQYLVNLPMHKDPDRFYIFVKELNPLNLISKHSLNVIQADTVFEKSRAELFKFEPEHPVIARRVCDPDDRGNAPSSRISIVHGHHRLYEIYRRYLVGEIEGDALVEVLKG